MAQQLLRKDWDGERSAMKGSHVHKSHQHLLLVQEPPGVPPALVEINTVQILGCILKHRRIWGCWDGWATKEYTQHGKKNKKQHGKDAKPSKEPARNT